MKTLNTESFLSRYGDDEKCLHAIFAGKNNGNQVICPECDKKTTYSKVRNRKCYQCSVCANQIYPLNGTIMQDTKVPLWKWFRAIYELSVSSNGISSVELAMRIGVRYQTAYNMTMKIRTLMKDDVKLSGVVEVDEALIGGAYGKTQVRRKMKNNQTTVLGAIERGGRIVLRSVPNRSKETVFNFIRENIEKGSTVYTDEHSIYTKLGKEGYVRDSVNHGKKEYVKPGGVHTNNIENVWKRFKAALRSTYTSVRPKNRQSYLDERSFVMNRSKDRPSIFNDLLEKITSTSVARSLSPTDD